MAPGVELGLLYDASPPPRLVMRPFRGANEPGGRRFARPAGGPHDDLEVLRNLLAEDLP